jgi:hypothetical protein
MKRSKELIMSREQNCVRTVANPWARFADKSVLANLRGIVTRSVAHITGEVIRVRIIFLCKGKKLRSNR